MTSDEIATLLRINETYQIIGDTLGKDRKIIEIVN